LHNHISTIDEDFEGENMTSEFSTQKTQAKDKKNFAASEKTNTDDNKK
jgi:hypothetical protein